MWQLGLVLFIIIIIIIIINLKKCKWTKQRVEPDQYCRKWPLLGSSGNEGQIPSGYKRVYMLTYLLALRIERTGFRYLRAIEPSVLWGWTNLHICNKWSQLGQALATTTPNTHQQQVSARLHNDPVYSANVVHRILEQHLLL
jgi:hypothetical protein